MLPIDNAFLVPGRGTVVIGTIAKGIIKKSDEAELLGFDTCTKTIINDIQVFKKSVQQVFVLHFPQTNLISSQLFLILGTSWR